MPPTQTLPGQYDAVLEMPGRQAGGGCIERSTVIYEIIRMNDLMYERDIIGDLFWREGQGDWDEAFTHWQRSLRLYDEIGDQRGLAITLRNLGEAYMLRKGFAEAEPLLRRARGLAEDLDDEEIRDGVDRDLAHLWAATHNP